MARGGAAGAGTRVGIGGIGGPAADCDPGMG
jgi:hypothetical protein